jgi:fatty-acyl-CoA synthase
MLARAEARVLFISQPFLDQMKNAGEWDDAPPYSTVVLEGDGPANAGGSDGPPLGLGSYAELLASEPPLASPVASLSSPLLIVFTSGSTGSPKGAVLTQEAVHCNALHSALMHDLGRSDRIITTLPFFHVGGINIQTLPALWVGATVTIVSQFDPAGFIDFVATHRPTLTVLVPAQMRQLMDLPAWEGADMSSFKAVTTGSSVVDKTLIRAWANKGVPVIQVYGCTESAPIAAHQTVEGIGPGLGTVGHAALYTELRIENGEGEPVATGTEGEILLRGPNIMSHYWRDPEATRAALQDGWLRTGDLGYLDGNGRLCVVGRKKQLIISGGENIHPVEVERALEQHAGVSQAAVVGVADPRWGEVPVAVVTLAAGTKLDELAIRDHLAQCLGRYKHPHRIMVVDTLPHTALGKVAYSEVSALVAASAPAPGQAEDAPAGSSR